MKSKGKTPLSILAILGLIVGAYLLGALKNTFPTPIAPISTITPTSPTPSPKATPTPAPAKKLTYKLPAGWKTVADSSGTFEVGYDPEKYKITGSGSTENLQVTISSVNQFQGYYFVALAPYDGGSRHKFILGNTVLQAQDKPEGYHEKSYTYNGQSCLVLYGVSISQWPAVEGMCAAGGTRAFRFGIMENNDAAVEKIISTIRLLR